MKLDEATKEKQAAFMNDLWKLMKQDGEVEETDEYCDRVLDAIIELGNKYQGEPFKHMLIGYGNAIHAMITQKG